MHSFTTVFVHLFADTQWPISQFSLECDEPTLDNTAAFIFVIRQRQRSSSWVDIPRLCDNFFGEFVASVLSISRTNLYPTQSKVHLRIWRLQTSSNLIRGSDKRCRLLFRCLRQQQRLNKDLMLIFIRWINYFFLTFQSNQDDNRISMLVTLE